MKGIQLQPWRDNIKCKRLLPAGRNSINGHCAVRMRRRAQKLRGGLVVAVVRMCIVGGACEIAGDRVTIRRVAGGGRGRVTGLVVARRGGGPENLAVEFWGNMVKDCLRVLSNLGKRCDWLPRILVRTLRMAQRRSFGPISKVRGRGVRVDSAVSARLMPMSKSFCSCHIPNNKECMCQSSSCLLPSTLAIQ